MRIRSKYGWTRRAKSLSFKKRTGPRTPLSPLLLTLLATLLLLATAGTVAATEYARNLVIEPGGNSTIITVKNAWPGAPELSYTLAPRGSAQPAGGETVIPTPLRRVISLSTPNIPFLRDLGVLDTLVGVDTTAYVYDETVLARIGRGEVWPVGSGANLDLERVIQLNPDLVLVSALAPDDATVARLRGANIPVLIVADWREATPLGRAEWIRLFGALYEQDQRARDLFQERAARYNQIRDLVATRIAPAARPTVLANGPWQGQWPVPAGESYVARLFADAGARYLWADTSGTGTLFLDFEVVLARGLAADYWINLNYDWTTLADVRRADPRLTAFAAWRSGQLYHHIRRVRPSGANDFWESGVGRPDLVLADLVWILHGGSSGTGLLRDHEPVYYRRIDP